MYICVCIFVHIYVFTCACIYGYMVLHTAGGYRHGGTRARHAVMPTLLRKGQHSKTPGHVHEHVSMCLCSRVCMHVSGLTARMSLQACGFGDHLMLVAFVWLMEAGSTFVCG